MGGLYFRWWHANGNGTLVHGPRYSFQKEIVEGAVDPLTKELDVITSKKSSEWGNHSGLHDANIKRFGFSGIGGDTIPRRTFDPAYVSTKPRSIDNYPYQTEDPNYHQQSMDLKSNKDLVDPRLMLCAGQPYVDEYINDKGKITYYDRSLEVNNQHDLLNMAAP